MLAPKEVIRQTAAEVRDQRAQKIKDAQSAFSDVSIDAQGLEFKQISELLTKTASLLNYEVNPQLNTVFDLNLHAREMRKRPELGGLAFVGQAALVEILKIENSKV